VYMDTFFKCFVASGATSDPLPHIFYNDIWRMNIDIYTLSVSWDQQPLPNPPDETQGVFLQFWKHNLTAFSMTAGLNTFSVMPFSATCAGTRIATYDYVNQRLELTTPIGGSWGFMAGGACGRYQDDVYCFGGFSCATFQDIKPWTKYNIPTNTFSNLASTNLGDMTARSMSSVTCFEDKEFCIIGSGNSAAGGTIDEWDMYLRDDDKFVFPVSSNTPVGIEYLTPDNPETWIINDGDFVVVQDKRKMLVVGGDQASGAINTSNTIRYVAEYNVNSHKFDEITTVNVTELFTIKQEYFRNIPKIRCQGDEEEGVQCDDDDECSYFIEYAGFEENPNVALHYPNEVVLYKWC